jgi:hypothetical protein
MLIWFIRSLASPPGSRIEKGDDYVWQRED